MTEMGRSMDRRIVMVIVAIVVAALGTSVVVLYVRGADNRADAAYHAVKVLKAVKPIAAGESISDAQAAGKIELGTVPAGDRLPDALSSLDAVGKDVATTAIYPGEQIISDRLGTGAAAAAAQNALSIPKGKMAISVNLSDPQRVAGFVNPGANVAVFWTPSDNTKVSLLLSKVEVIGVGATTIAKTTTTDTSGAQTTDSVPSTLLTLALSQADSERVIFASANGSLSFGLLTGDSQVAPSQGVTAKNLLQQ